MKKNKRYKLEIEVYADKSAIDKFMKSLIKLDPQIRDKKNGEVYVRVFPCDFSPKAFFKMCEELEKKAYEYMNKEKK